MKERFIKLPANRLVAIDVRVPDCGKWSVPTDGLDRSCIVKLTITVPEHRLQEVDRKTIQTYVQSFVHQCRTPDVVVLRRTAKRDAEHRPELPLVESLQLFAQETNPPDPKHKVQFAAQLAREADAEVEQ